MAELCTIIESTVRERGAALMGVVNVTPDSFFDGGKYAGAHEAAARIDALIELGTTIIDIGGESTRPGSEPVSAAEQIDRVGPAIAHAVARGALVSIDTTCAEVAHFALQQGARIVNDVSCLTDAELASVAARHGAALVLTHSRGSMGAMKGFSAWPDKDYRDVVADVLSDWRQARDRAVARGLAEDHVWFDPGIGFSKNARQSFELLRRLPELRGAARIVVVGPGRKSFISAVDPSPPGERLGGTIAASLVSVLGGAHVLRVHDVREVRQAIAVLHAASDPWTPTTEARRAG